MNIKREKNTFFDIKIIKTFADSKIIPTFASAFEKNSCSIKSRIRFSDDGAKKKMQKFLKKDLVDWKRLHIFAVRNVMKKITALLRLVLWITGNIERKRNVVFICQIPLRKLSSQDSNKTLFFIQWRVWSWLRMNASGRLNTRKSRGSIMDSNIYGGDRRTGA